MGLSQAVYDATRDIEKYDKEKREAIQGVIKRGTQATLEEAIRQAPHETTGNLQTGIKSSFQGGMYARGRVVSTAPHSHLAEFGTGPRITYPKKAKVLKFPDGGFQRSSAPHALRSKNSRSKTLRGVRLLLARNVLYFI